MAVADDANNLFRSDLSRVVPDNRFGFGLFRSGCQEARRNGTLLLGLFLSPKGWYDVRRSCGWVLVGSSRTPTRCCCCCFMAAARAARSAWIFRVLAATADLE